MVDRPRSGDPAGDASHEAARRMLVDALTAPGTPDELSREHDFLDAFRVLSAGASARAAATARRGRRLRMAALGGLAALAVTGTAAALTGTYPGAGPDPAPPSRSLPAPLPTASTGPHTTRPGGTTTPRTPTASGGPVTTSGPTSALASSASSSASSSAPSSGRPGTSSSSAPATGSSSTSTPPASSPSTSTSGSSKNPRALENYCKQFERGKVKEGSPKWLALVEAAGSAAAIPDFCAALLGEG